MHTPSQHSSIPRYSILALLLLNATTLLASKPNTKPNTTPKPQITLPLYIPSRLDKQHKTAHSTLIQKFILLWDQDIKEWFHLDKKKAEITQHKEKLATKLANYQPQQTTSPNNNDNSSTPKKQPTTPNNNDNSITPNNNDNSSTSKKQPTTPNNNDNSSTSKKQPATSNNNDNSITPKKQPQKPQKTSGPSFLDIIDICLYDHNLAIDKLQQSVNSTNRLYANIYARQRLEHHQDKAITADTLLQQSQTILDQNQDSLQHVQQKIVPHLNSSLDKKVLSLIQAEEQYQKHLLHIQHLQQLHTQHQTSIMHKQQAKLAQAQPSPTPSQHNQDYEAKQSIEQAKFVPKRARAAFQKHFNRIFVIYNNAENNIEKVQNIFHKIENILDTSINDNKEDIDLDEILHNITSITQRKVAAHIKAQNKSDISICNIITTTLKQNLQADIRKTKHDLHIQQLIYQQHLNHQLDKANLQRAQQQILHHQQQPTTHPDQHNTIS